MDAWNQKHHRASGLYDRVLSSTITMRDAELQTLEFAKQHGAAKKMPLAGNSIWQDRRFLCRHMPELEAYLHYRIVDVSSFKELVRRWYPHGITPTKKKEAHRALDDIRESIHELTFYRKYYMIPTDAAPKTAADLEAKVEAPAAATTT
jgi:oligoribonuclease